MKKTLARLSHLNHRLLKTVLAPSILMLSISAAQSAGLGKMKVLSALGAPFKAEVELSNIRADEEVNLTARIAPPEVFKQAGIDYSPALANIRATLNKENGTSTVTLTSNSTVNEPLLEMLIELNWQSGRLVRQYTVLLDPLSALTDAPVPVDAPQPAIAQTNADTSPPPAVPAPDASNTQAKTISKVSVANSADSANNIYDVKSGDTLFGIASRLNNGDNAQLKSLMANLLRNNPQAFIGNNMNKLKAGVVLNTGAADVAASSAPAMSTGAPSKAFSQYKQAATGKVKPLANKNDDSKAISSTVKPAAKAAPAPSAQDQLKVAGSAAVGNKAMPATGKTAEEKIVKDRAVAEEKSRLAELQKNIQKTVEVKNNALASAATTLPGAATKPPASATPAVTVAPATSAIAAPANAVSVPAPPATPATPATAIVAPVVAAAPAGSATSAATSDTNVAQLNKPAEPIKPALAPAVIAPAAAVETSWYEGIDPLIAGGVAAALGLGGLLVYRRRKNKQEGSEFADSAFSPKDTQGTLLTGEGGQAVDTFNSVFVSSFADGNTPLESAEVDPVAEADVYMQYGRDAHAEDILKDALKQNPNRHAVRLKLMELHASKQNTQELSAQFKTLSELTQSSGEDWKAGQQIMAALGSSVVNLNDHTKTLASELSIASLIKAKDETTGEPLPLINLGNPTMIGDVPSGNTTLIKPNVSTPASPSPAALNMPINLATTMMKSPSTLASTNSPDMLNFEMNTTTMFAAPSPAPSSASTDAKAALVDIKSPNSVIEFNVSKFDLNPPSIFDKVSGESSASTVQATETKFSLAQAYMDIGDKEGAKELLHEVLESGHQSLADQAKTLLLKI